MSVESEITAPTPAPASVVSPWWRRPLVWGAAGLLVGVAAVSIAWGLSSPSSPASPGVFTLHGSVLLGIGSDAEVTQQTCTGGGPYMDIAAGAQVTVTNASGSVVGAGTLGTGHWGTGNDDPNSCRFTYAVKVSKGSAFYGVQIAQRPKMTVSAQSAESKVLGQSLEGL